MPGWHKATEALQKQGKLQMIGIIQEQHPDRCRLFMQWKRMDWPILVDSLNLTGVAVVPLTYAIDEHGIVRFVKPSPENMEEFLTVAVGMPVTWHPPGRGRGYPTPSPTDRRMQIYRTALVRP